MEGLPGIDQLTNPVIILLTNDFLLAQRIVIIVQQKSDGFTRFGGWYFLLHVMFHLPVLG